MAKECLNCKQIGTIFIKVSAKGMAERMAGQMMCKAKFNLFGRNKLVDRVRNHVLIRVVHFWKQQIGRASWRERV